MVRSAKISVRNNDILLLVGTMKGLFLFRSNAARKRKHRVLTEEGGIRPHDNVFVDADNVRDLEGLATRIPDSCEIAILPAVSGGSEELKIAD